MKREYTISLPLYIVIGIKKPRNVYINLNNYRNWHYHVSDELKKKYKELVTTSLVTIPDNLEKISTTYTIYYPNCKRFDIMNIASITSKFFEDALVLAGKLHDDNYEYIPETHVYFGGVDKLNPRVDVKIKEL